MKYSNEPKLNGEVDFDVSKKQGKTFISYEQKLSVSGLLRLHMKEVDDMAGRDNHREKLTKLRENLNDATSFQVFLYTFNEDTYEFLAVMKNEFSHKFHSTI